MTGKKFTTKILN